MITVNIKMNGYDYTMKKGITILVAWFDTLKMLREEKNRLTELQAVQREDFNARREYERELRTVCSNVDIILGTSQVQNRQREHTQEKS